MWLARLTQWGMLRPSFGPPAAIRRVRDFTRARTGLVRERTRVLQRLEKLLEDAMVKITSVAKDELKAKSAMAMVAGADRRGTRPAHARRPGQGAAAGQEGPARRGAGWHVRLPPRGDRADAAGPGRVPGPADQADGSQAIAALAQVEESWGVDPGGETGPGRGTGPDSQVLAAAYRLAEIPGVSVWLAIVIIAETGLNMALFPTPAHLVSWIGLCRSATQSGARHGKGKQKKGNSYARAAAGQAALGAAGTATFLGERYRRIARRRGGAIAQVAVARSIMIIAWHLLSDPAGPLPRPRPGLARPPTRACPVDLEGSLPVGLGHGRGQVKAS